MVIMISDSCSEDGGGGDNGCCWWRMIMVIIRGVTMVVVIMTGCGGANDGSSDNDDGVGGDGGMERWLLVVGLTEAEVMFGGKGVGEGQRERGRRVYNISGGRERYVMVAIIPAPPPRGSDPHSPCTT